MRHSIPLILTAAFVLSISGCRDDGGSPQAFRGYPSPEGAIDIRSGFLNPPDGYGNVPFFWWSGDTLRLDRLGEELDLLADSPTDGFSISYNHTHHQVDTLENAAGHGPNGVADYGQPRAFGEQWWKIWNDFSGLCADRGMGVGMDDYVFALPGNHDFMDRALSTPGFETYQGRLKTVTVPAGAPLPEHTLTTYPAADDSVTAIFTSASPVLHPDLGRRIIEVYFQPFEDHMDARGRKGMNYFFQDELTYYPDLTSWCEDMPEQFLRRKGYDITPHLPSLFEDKGEESVRTRLDYAEVVTELTEERFFKPIYDWHAGRGLIYGCDNQGRGLEPTVYMDYFRASSWFTAPGNDAPARGSSFTQTKVSSSVAHLYQRPRTWLEAFHSMGWDANGAVLTHQLDHHIIAGGNLLCMHGLYYSTHGGWWEWAPPSFHFRMPYWPHMKKWLRYAERLCFVLSQGRHVCDVAILYPTETMQAIPGTDFDFCREVSETISRAGIDFDFIDYKSLQNASVSDGTISVAGENYKVLILADIRAMHEDTAEAIARFEAGGGLVLRLDENPERAVSFIDGHIVRDFLPGSGEGRVLHRRIAENDVYMIMDVEKGDSVFFRCHGRVECWDAMNGTITEIPALRTDENGTWLRFDGEKGSSKLVVFSPGEALTAVSSDHTAGTVTSIPLDGDWDITTVPTMNNKWGDFRLPARDEMIGVEVRRVKSECPDVDFPEMTGEDICGYGPYMLTRDGRNSRWRPYVWSWQYGVTDSPGSQGYHGNKSKVDRGFLILDRGADQQFMTFVYAPSDGDYRIIKEGVTPSVLLIDDGPVCGESVHLGEGWHRMFLEYRDTRKEEYSLEELVCYTVDTRERSMVMLYPESAPIPQDRSAYDTIVASRWYGTDFLRFSPYPCDGDRHLWKYTFETAPGTHSFSAAVLGDVREVAVDGTSIPFTLANGILTADIPHPDPHVSTVTILAAPNSDAPGAAFFAEPVRLECHGGKMPEGDWTLQGALKYYSGGILYSRKIHIDDTSGRWILDLGEVDATCEVIVNGMKADELLRAPYSTDISSLTGMGENTVEVLVYSSLANYYQTIPTPYRGTPHAGLCGPAVLNVIR